MLEEITKTAIVTPCVGVWIEIKCTGHGWQTILSLPAWECGLKLYLTAVVDTQDDVTPCVGVWIEIMKRLTACFLT